MSWHEKGLLCFDLETTGPDPMEARIVTWAITGLLPNGEVSFTRSGVVDPGVPISSEAAEVHGYTNERAKAEGESPKAALRKIAMLLQVAPHTPICAFNASFDMTIAYLEANRYGILHLAQDLTTRSVIDPLVIDKQVDKYRKGKRQLQPTCELYEVELGDWHSAEADCVAAGRLAQAIAKRYPETHVPAPLMHKWQVTWRAEQSSSLQGYLRRSDPKALVDGGWPLLNATRQMVL